MENYVVSKRSRKQIRETTVRLRKILNLDNSLYFPIIEVLDRLCVEYDGFNYTVVDFGKSYSNLCAQSYPDEGFIEIDEKIFNSASEGNGRDRFTIAHELGHVFLHRGENSLNHEEWKESCNKRYESSEWQADCFAGELLIPKLLVADMEVSAVMNKCGVSYDAAKTQLNSYSAKKRKGVEMNKIRDQNKKKLFD